MHCHLIVNPNFKARFSLSRAIASYLPVLQLNQLFNMTAQAVKWYRSLGFQGLASLGCITLLLFAGIVLVINTRGKRLLSKESSQLIEVIGNNAVSELNARSLEIAALARTLAVTTEQLPKSEATFKKTVPELINFQRDLAVAGGGVWPEPYAFQPNKQRRSFFWGRNSKGTLQYYDDYNQPGLGYHHEEWYVPVRYSKPDTCYWSKSYIDPYSYQPMVTCTVATFSQGKFSGAVTIDLKLEGLQAFAKSLQNETGGYVFILDRNNKFITFPKPNLVKRISKDSQGARTEEFLLASELAAKQPSFLPLSEAAENINKEILSLARQMPSYRPSVAAALDRSSYQIDQSEAELIAGVIIDPIQAKQSTTRLYTKVHLENDFLLKKVSTAFIFHVPGSYWKLIIVKPVSEINAVTLNIIQWLTSYVLIIIVVIMIAAFYVLNKFLIQPLSQTTNAVKVMGTLVANKQFDQISNFEIKPTSSNEIGLLTQVFNILATQIFEQHNQLEQANEELEVKVSERTTQLARANTQILALNDRLKTENLRMGTELAITRRLQQMILPREVELGQVPGLEIAGFMEPANEVGGDYYDVLNHNGRIKIGIGDVTGHGLESSVLMIMVQTAVRTLLENNETDSTKFLSVLNRTIYHNVQRMSSDKNMTLALLDYQAGRLRLSGQHEEMLIVRAGGKVERVDTIDLGFPIGLEADITPFIGQIEVQLYPGDGAVLYTDGIPEAENDSGVPYGLEHFCEVVSRNWQRSAVEIKQAVIDDLRHYIGQHRVYDDITLLVLKQK
ncbi:MAG TPA: SpoIIE family protein phosphatase [Candidatus Caenarcaniphilales bacterium]